MIALLHPVIRATALSKLWQAPTTYVKLYRNRIQVHVPGRERPVEKFSDFSHPRMLLGEFEQAAITLRAALHEAYPRRLGRPALIIQPMELTDGGLSATEQYLLQQLSRSAGARRCHVWIGPELSAEEVSDFVF